ncbi:MAG: hypothetical protein ABI026_04100 [Gemmatimonadaceae bacterium]
MNTQKNTLRSQKLSRFISIATAAFGLVVVVPAIAGGQQSVAQTSHVDSRWQPWIGCWRAAPPQMNGITFSQPRTDDTPLVCVVPATGSAAALSNVNVLTVAKDKIVSRDTIEVTGKNVARTKDACVGVEKAEWSSDGNRLYVSSDFSCPGNLKRTSSGLFAMSPQGEWVNVQEVNAGGNKGVRTLRYVPALTSATLPAEISDALSDRGVAETTARSAAGAPLTTANIVEASHKLDPMVVEAWIVDRGQSFNVDAKQLLALSDAGVPGNVTDAMVAVTYPKAFDVTASRDENGLATIGEAQSSAAYDAASTGARVPVVMLPYSRYNYSPFGYSPYDYYGGVYSPYGYAPYGYAPFGYSPYGGYYSPYSAYSRYGGVYGGGWYAPPVIVLKGNGTPQPAGRAVKGRGYTQTEPRSGNQGQTGGSTASPRPAVSPPPAQPAPPERTAHKRP